MLELIFIKLLKISLQASFFILAVILIRLCFKRLPKRYVCVLWALVAVRLVLPFEITSAFSLVPDTSRVVSWADASLSENALESNNQTTENTPAQDYLLPPGAWQPNASIQNNAGLNNTIPGSNLVQDDIPSGNSTDTTNNTGTRTSTLNLAFLLSRIWLIGTLVLLIYDLASYLRLKFRLREAIHAQDNIWYSDQIPAPFVLGYLKPRIYMPFSIQKEQMPYIIAHEQAHILHLDHLTKLLAALLVCVYWFNPFIWIAYLLYCKDLELACDERVIAKLGNEEKKPYSEALLLCSVTNKALLQSPLSFSEVAIKDRIVNILNYKKPGFWGMVLAVVVCVVAGVCFLTSPDMKKEAKIDIKTVKFLEQTTVEMLDQVKTKYPELMTQYATQLDDYPGTVQHTGVNQFTVTVESQDYGCLIATDPNTRETVYIWPDDYIPKNVDRSWPPLNNATTSKEYPLEIVDDVVREVPARVLTENIVAKYAFGKDVLETTYRLHPYGIKQYILRENGTLHVNIGYEAPEHVAFQYLTFQIGEDGETVTLEDYGTGYYLLYLNNVEALDAFRNTYTGEGRVLPSDTSQLPWDWLLAINGEENDAPRLKEADLPVVQQNYQFAYFPGYNLTDRFNGFIVSERVVNGEVFTEFRYRDNTDDICILTGTNHYDVVSINYNGEEKPLPAQHLDIFTGGVGAYGTVYYMDVTGDTQKELIFEWGGGGTGAWDNYCYVYNPETMEPYPIDLDVSQMTSKLKVTLTDFEPEGGALSFNLAYENQTADVKDQLYFSFDPENDTTKMSLAEANRYFHYTPDAETHNVYYNPETGCLEAEVWIAIQNTIPMTYAGKLNVPFTWDNITEKFAIDLDTVNLITSNNYSAETDTSAQDTEEPVSVYYPTTYYYSPAQYMKDINWESISTRITDAENEALQKYLPYLTEEEKFVWIYLLPESTYDNNEPVYAHKQVSIRELLADQMDTDGVDLVEPIVDEFCFADLFQTGSTDLIMLLRNQSYEWLIFHEENGVMYCIDMYVRWLSGVREDGLYSSSSGASNTSYHRMTFSDGAFTIETVADITHYQYETHEEFYIDGVKKTAAEYAAWESENLSDLVPRYTPLLEEPSSN